MTNNVSLSIETLSLKLLATAELILLRSEISRPLFTISMGRPHHFPRFPPLEMTKGSRQQLYYTVPFEMAIKRLTSDG